MTNSSENEGSKYASFTDSELHNQTSTKQNKNTSTSVISVLKKDSGKAIVISITTKNAGSQTAQTRKMRSFELKYQPNQEMPDDKKHTIERVIMLRVDLCPWEPPQGHPHHERGPKQNKREKSRHAARTMSPQTSRARKTRVGKAHQSHDTIIE